MDKPDHCQYPAHLGGCEAEEVVPVHWGDDKTIIGWLCTYHAMSLMMKGLQK